MRVREGITLATLAALAVAAGSVLVACFDLLHSTADVLTACEIDAGHPGCVAAKVETDFCAWTEGQAAQRAAYACTWLGACESPMGNNAFGACYFRALMAYDCAANPDHRPQQKSRELWDCLQQVRSCADVDACMFPDESTACRDTGVFTACSTSDPTDRVFCSNRVVPAGRENCALWGQTCSPTAGGSTCSGDPTGRSCPGSPQCGANGTTLHWCVPDADGGPGIDRGIECASNGAGACGGFPSPDPGSTRWLACRPGTDAGTPCTPDPSATCDHGRATMCPAGVQESLDCHALLGEDDACSTGALSPPFDWTSPCALSMPCGEDSCDGSSLLSCERGARFEIDCRQQGLGDCRLVTVDPSGPARAACKPPP
jgi:hypothetical protein